MHIRALYYTGDNCMMQISHHGTLLQNVHYDLALRHQIRMNLLLFGIVRSDGGNKDSWRDVAQCEYWLPRRRASHANIALPNCSRQIWNRRDLDPQLCGKLPRQTLG